MVYQEQVMQTAQVLGGYNLGGADMLRRAMGKKRPRDGRAPRHLPQGRGRKRHQPDKADEVFDLMEKFAGYGFNKSHAAAYSLLAYHPAGSGPFHCRVLLRQHDGGNGRHDKLKVLFEDAQELRDGVQAPNINRGRYRFRTVTTSDSLWSGAVNTGQRAIEAIVAARGARRQAGCDQRAFTSLFDFCVRVTAAADQQAHGRCTHQGGRF